MKQNKDALEHVKIEEKNKLHFQVVLCGKLLKLGDVLVTLSNCYDTVLD